MCIPSSCEAEEAASHILSFFNSYWHVNNVTMSFDEDLCQLKDDAYPNISSRAALAMYVYKVVHYSTNNYDKAIAVV